MTLQCDLCLYFNLTGSLNLQDIQSTSGLVSLMPPKNKKYSSALNPKWRAGYPRQAFVKTPQTGELEQAVWKSF